jgi:integrase/recombinase XerD
MDQDGFILGAIPLLRPEQQTLDEMLDGRRNQRLSRNLAARRS